MDREYVCVIGSLNYDMIMKQKRLPVKGETYTADSISYFGGGKGANQAVQCAKLGLDTIMVGKVGRDRYGDILLSRMKNYGVDCSCIGRSRLSTGVGMVHALEDGSVYASIITGANFDMGTEEIDRLEYLIKNSRLLILQLEIPVPVVEHIITLAERHGVYTIVNAAPAKEIRKKILKKADCLIVNETEASFYAGVTISNQEGVAEYAKLLGGMAKNTVIVTLGSSGSVLLEQDKITVIDPVAVHAVETTGAGDSYIGSFAYGKFHGMADEAACRFAAKVSAVTVTKIGAQEAMPVLAEVAGAVEGPVWFGGGGEILACFEK